MISLRNSLILFIIFPFLMGCSSLKPKGELSSFPIEPNWKPYTTKPVLFYDKTNQTYTITKEYMNNAVLQVLFIEEIKLWKVENDIK